MPRHKTGLTHKIGLPPGILLHTHQNRSAEPQLTIIYFDQERADLRQITLEELASCRDFPGKIWLHVNGAQHVPTVEAIGQCFALHPLVLEDILTHGHRPKIEDYVDYTFMVLTANMMSGGKHVSEHISIVLGSDYVVSFQEEDSDLFLPVRERLLSAKGRIRNYGSDYLAYALLDMVVDHFFGVLEHLGGLVENLEQDVVVRPSPDVLRKIHELKNDLLFLRKAVWPLREMIGSIERGQSSLFAELTLLYVRDVYDHVAQAIDTLEMYREMASGLLDIYLSSQSMKMNEIIKLLTIISTMFMPLTFIVGLYGMNFKYMPELEWEWGYPLVLLVMLLMSVGMLWYFRRRRWI